MIRTIRFAAVALALLAPPVSAQVDPALRTAYERLRATDLRLATIAYRLTTANAALCRDLAPTPGWQLHALGQYEPPRRAAVRAVFGFETPVAVELVVPGSAAARAGIAADDSLVAIAGRPIAAPDPGAAPLSADARDAAQAAIAAQPATAPIAVRLKRAGAERDAAIPASPGCRSAFEVMVGGKRDASADGDVVQIGEDIFGYTDDEVAVVAAHELAHNILRHRVRLDAAGVKRGLLKEFGRNARLFRVTEDQADRLGVILLRNAGYDPQIAVRFWNAHGGEVGSEGLLRSRTHGSAAQRGALIAAEIAAMPAGAPRPYLPPILAERDRPLR